MRKEISKLKNRITEMDGEKKALEQKLKDERATRRNLKLSVRNLNKEKGEQELKIKQL